MADLEKRRLGRTGLDVTMLGYGAMELRGAPRGRPVDRQEAVAVLNAVLDGGVNFIDTSIDYGISEELIGEAIGHRRGEFYLASKCGCVVGAAPAPAGQRNPHVFTRENITAGVNQSLARMKTDYLDLVQFHASPSRETLEQHAALETLRDLQREGKIRFIGISGTLPNLPEQIAMDVFDAFQIPYSALQREHEGLISKAARSGGGTVIRGGVAKGIPTDGREPGDPWQLWEKAGLDDLLDGMTRMEFILRFTLSHPDLHTTIVGTKSMEHLQQNLAAARKGPLLSDVYEEAKRRLSAAGAVPEPTTT